MWQQDAYARGRIVNRKERIRAAQLVAFAGVTAQEFIQRFFAVIEASRSFFLPIGSSWSATPWQLRSVWQWARADSLADLESASCLYPKAA
jgi:hypothetical protein